MSLETEIRGIVREEIRSALREMLPAAAPVVEMLAPYLSTKEAAETAGVRPETIRTWIDSDKLRSHRAGRLIRILRSDLDTFLDGEAKTADAPIDLEKRAREILASRARGSR